MASKPGNELATLTDSGFAIATIEGGAGNIAEVMRENMGDSGGASVFDLDRVKVPSGGALTWEVPTLDGPEPSKTLDGIIVAWRDVRAYWRESIDEGGAGKPPDCSSDDAIVGVGDPGGRCKTCPMAQFGSAHNRDGSEGRGQACKHMRLVFMLRPTDLLPLVVFAPPTSMKPLRQYFMRLTSAGAFYYSVVTSLGLAKASNADNIDYAQIVPTVASRLDPEAIAAVKSYAAALSGTFASVTLDEGDVLDGESADDIDTTPVS